jgi:hypothetical protein
MLRGHTNRATDESGAQQPEHVPERNDTMHDIRAILSHRPIEFAKYAEVIYRSSRLPRQEYANTRFILIGRAVLVKIPDLCSMAAGSQSVGD